MAHTHTHTHTDTHMQPYDNKGGYHVNFRVSFNVEFSLNSLSKSVSICGNIRKKHLLRQIQLSSNKTKITNSPFVLQSYLPVAIKLSIEFSQSLMFTNGLFESKKSLGLGASFAHDEFSFDMDF